MTDERRSAPRVPVHLPVLIYVAGRKEPIKGQTRDLSVGGAFVDCPEPLPIGTRVLLQILLEGTGLIHGHISSQPSGDSGPSGINEESVVRWARTGENSVGFGVQFLNPTFEVRERIKQLLEAAAEKSE